MVTPIKRRLFPYPSPAITAATLMRWAVMSGAVGFAQMFRTPYEQLVGFMMLLGSWVLLMAAKNGKARVAFFGFSWLSAWMAGRAVAGPWVALDWHGAVIIVAAWGMFAYLCAERANAAHRIVQGVPR